MKKLLSVVIISGMFIGCGQVAYKKYGVGLAGTYDSKVGYSDFEIGKNKYKVTYTGGSYEDQNKVTKFAYKRAKELCVEKGFTTYKVSNTESSSTEATGSFSDSQSKKVYMLDVTCE